MVPSEDYSHGPPCAAGFFSEGRETETNSRAHKKKTMKTNQNQKSELQSRSEQLSTPENNTPENTAYQMPDGSWTSEVRSRNMRSIQPGFHSEAEALDDAKRRVAARRVQIDMARRRENRALPTDSVLDLLHKEAPRFWELAEVVGQWVWIQFSEKQPPQITSVLAELGFHWNNKRQAWQHPCGTVAEGSGRDPRQKYGSYFAADTKAA